MRSAIDGSTSDGGMPQSIDTDSHAPASADDSPASRRMSGVQLSSEKNRSRLQARTRR